MEKPGGVKKAAAGTLLAGALSLTSLFGGVANADTPSVSELVVTKVTDSTSPLLQDGQDFLIWQRGGTTSGSANGGIWRTTNFDTPVPGQGESQGSVTGRITAVVVDPAD